MSNLAINKISNRTVEINDGTKAVQIHRDARNTIWCCVQNASHRAWKGMGRRFDSFDAARFGYKSSFMQAAIDVAEEEIG